METKPEGFLWCHKGELDDDKFAGDIGERIPGAVCVEGLLDAQVLKDTLIVDRAAGKALVDLTREGGAALPHRHVRGARAAAASRTRTSSGSIPSASSRRRSPAR